MHQVLEYNPFSVYERRKRHIAAEATSARDYEQRLLAMVEEVGV